MHGLAIIESTDPGWVGWVDPVERRIIGAVLMQAARRGWHGRIHDGEAWAGPWTAVLPELVALVGTTDETVLHLRRSAGDQVGWVRFIHGNGVDVWSDSSDTPELEALFRAVRPVIDGEELA